MLSRSVSTVGSTRTTSTVYRFGPYEVDTAINELRKFGLRIKLERKPLQLLIRLLDRAGEVVGRADLQHFLWGEEIFVDFDKGLGVAVTKLRAALSDSAENPKYIETVAGEGYRFIAKVEQITVAATAEHKQGAQVPSIPGADQVHVPLPAVDARKSGLWKRRAAIVVALVACLASVLIGALNL